MIMDQLNDVHGMIEETGFMGRPNLYRFLDDKKREAFLNAATNYEEKRTIWLLYNLVNVGAAKNTDWLYNGTEEIEYKDRNNRAFMPRFHDERYWPNLPTEGVVAVTATPAFRSAPWEIMDYYETFVVHLSNMHIGWGRDSSPEMSQRAQDSFQAILPFLFGLAAFGGFLVKCMFFSKGKQWESNNVAPIAYRAPASIGINGLVVTGILATSALY